VLPTKEKEITRTEASFLGGTKLKRGRHSGSSPKTLTSSLFLFFKDMWAALRFTLDLLQFSML
jgi:hypothetical protein